MTTNTQTLPDELPNGPVLAALIAGGIGSTVVGLFTILAEASEPIKNALNWYNPVGPLTGKTLLGVIAFFVSWGVMHYMFKGKNLNFTRAVTVAFVLLAIGLLATFPPFFEIFAAE